MKHITIILLIHGIKKNTNNSYNSYIPLSNVQCNWKNHIFNVTQNNAHINDNKEYNYQKYPYVYNNQILSINHGKKETNTLNYLNCTGENEITYLNDLNSNEQNYNDHNKNNNPYNHDHNIIYNDVYNHMNPSYIYNNICTPTNFIQDLIKTNKINNNSNYLNIFNNMIHLQNMHNENNHLFKKEKCDQAKPYSNTDVLCTLKNNNLNENKNVNIINTIPHTLNNYYNFHILLNILRRKQLYHNSFNQLISKMTKNYNINANNNNNNDNSNLNNNNNNVRYNKRNYSISSVGFSNRSKR